MKINRFIMIIPLFFLVTLTGCLKSDHRSSDFYHTMDDPLKKVVVLTAKVSPRHDIVHHGVDFIHLAETTGKYGGEISTAILGSGPKTFNPWVSKDATSSSIGGLIFDGLVTTHANTGKPIPQLAKSITVHPNNLEYRIILRKGLKWSDGKPITADDVVFTWNTIIRNGFGNTSLRDNVLIEGKFPQVIKIDDYAIIMKTIKPFAPFLRELGTPIAPKHIFQKVTQSGYESFNAFWGVNTDLKKMVTSGKFMLHRYEPGQRVILKRNPGYYMLDKHYNRLPYVSQYILSIVGDLNNEILKFKAGEIDFMGVPGANAAQFKEEEKKSDYTMYNLGPTTSTTFMSFNLNNRKDKNGKPFVNTLKQSWFQDVNFRKAIDYAIDREGIVANVVQGVGQPLFTAESLSSIFLHKKLAEGHEKNIQQAMTYLSQSGFYLDKDKQLRDKHGHKVEFSLLTNAGNLEREAIGVIIKEDLKELGIKVNFKALEFNVLVGKLTSSFDWETVIIGLTGSALEPHSGKSVWISTGGLHFFNQRLPQDLGSTLYSWERKLNQIFEAGATTLNLSQRHRLYSQYQEVVYNNLPMIYLYSPLSIIAVRNKFGNLKPTTLGGVEHNLEEIYIK